VESLEKVTNQMREVSKIEKALIVHSDLALARGGDFALKKPTTLIIAYEP